MVFHFKRWKDIKVSAASLTVRTSNQWANTADIPYPRIQFPHGGNYRKKNPQERRPTPYTLVNIHTPATTFLSIQLEFLISRLVLMEINGKTPW